MRSPFSGDTTSSVDDFDDWEYEFDDGDWREDSAGMSEKASGRRDEVLERLVHQVWGRLDVSMKRRVRTILTPATSLVIWCLLSLETASTLWTSPG